MKIMKSDADLTWLLHDPRNLNEPRFQIEFIKRWVYEVHKLSHEIFEPAAIISCSPFQAERLVHTGYAKLLPKEGRGDHFCPDWDEMLICRDDPEWELCHCGIKT